MLDLDLTKNVINDILLTKEYSLLGVAHYTHTPEEVLFDIVIGKNKNPSLHVFQKVIELHRSVHSTLYEEILRKITQRNKITCMKPNSARSISCWFLGMIYHQLT